MIEKIEHPAYENNVKKINEVIDFINSLNFNPDDYVLTGAVGNAANKIPIYNTEGHLVLPDGTEIYGANL